MDAVLTLLTPYFPHNWPVPATLPYVDIALTVTQTYLLYVVSVLGIIHFVEFLLFWPTMKKDQSRSLFSHFGKTMLIGFLHWRPIYISQQKSKKGGKKKPN